MTNEVALIHEKTARELGISLEELGIILEDSVARMIEPFPPGRIETADDVAQAVAGCSRRQPAT